MAFQLQLKNSLAFYQHTEISSPFSGIFTKPGLSSYLSPKISIPFLGDINNMSDFHNISYPFMDQHHHKLRPIHLTMDPKVNESPLDHIPQSSKRDVSFDVSFY